MKLLMLCAAMLAASSAHAASLGERLGFAPNQKVLILHADDIGSIASANRAFDDQKKFGLIQSGSVMMPAPEALNAVRTFGRDSDLGVHITLTSEWANYRWAPTAHPEEVPSLVDRKGFLPDGLLNLFVWGKERDVANEMEAQMQMALRAGMQPSHMDMHMGGPLGRPSWVKAYLNLGRKYRVPPMLPKMSEELRKQYGFLGGAFMALYASGIINQAERAGFLLLDYLVDHPLPETKNYNERKAAYLEILRNLKPGVTQVIFHPAYADADFQKKILSSNPEQILREWEANIFQDPEVKAEIERLGIQLIGWKKIQEAYRWDEVQDLK
jgi:predicted glycoside hydrolase/deacetylase ChbG (UPF0249 family)